MTSTNLNGINNAGIVMKKNGSEATNSEFGNNVERQEQQELPNLKQTQKQTQPLPPPPPPKGGNANDIENNAGPIANLSIVLEGDDENDLEGGKDYSVSLDDSNSMFDSSPNHHMTEEASFKISERDTLARKETLRVAMLRLFVGGLFVVVPALAAWQVYRYTSNAEHNNYKSAYIAAGTKVIETFALAIEGKLNAMDSLAIQITTYALTSDENFPTVTLPYYEFSGSAARVLGETITLNWHPLVTDETREQWEIYANKTYPKLLQAGISEYQARLYQDEQFNLPVTDQQDGNGSFGPPAEYPYEIFGVGREGTAPEPPNAGPYLPFWQSSPAIPLVEALNFNMLKHVDFRDGLLAALETKQALLTNVYDLKDPNFVDDTAQETYSQILSISIFRDHSFEEYSGDPQSGFVYPVFTDFSLSKNRTLAGVLRASLYWRVYFANILPDYQKGLYVVMENTQDQMFTYRLDGPEVTYLGPGDRHDKKYDNKRLHQDIVQYLSEHRTASSRSYTGADWNTDFCGYSISVYPSSDFENAYTSRGPIVATVVVLCVFLFTTAVFVFYDFLVEKRQSIVMDRAVTSGAIVSNIFPENVKEKLMQETKEQEKEELARNSAASPRNKSSAWMAKNKNKLGSNLSLASSSDDQASIDSNGLSVQPSLPSVPTKPLAELFPACTVFFADLVGFTQWSAKRQPDQVFYLLEALYGAFDKIANRYRVFKIETIGDCYLAITGCPEEQDLHAVTITKFSYECIHKMADILQSRKLKQVLSLDGKITEGDDTSNLRLRVGLHSGPVTAGVLRNQKSRFQIFGDTVNTAARMESNGVPGKIHISQQTADALIAQGKSKWIIPRKDKITAKGKGQLQTYFVDNIRSNATSSIHSGRDADTLMPMEADSGSELKNDKI